MQPNLDKYDTRPELLLALLRSHRTVGVDSQVRMRWISRYRPVSPIDPDPGQGALRNGQKSEVSS